ncbi:hypothetical protein AXA44_05745 [Rhodococcus sp. SC4]|uniref:Dabb family protein n=1 Tax=Rhodococcus sp. LB1 TaxID=1807499 RepID=UPI000769F22B|nr:Dabb family protein [Rhodococcus sp. LB1]KXF54729.1 hypothetical protein AXA44_05745 [Rhodococcus sp. SC4]KXX55979.1 hypothetical protein AZG88_16770 [Rhodococcus sp. LB1]
MPICHIVTLSFTADLPAEVMPQLEQRLTEFVDGRAGIVSYTCGIDLGLHESNADFAIAASFDSMTALEAYTSHPRHQAIIAEFARPYLVTRSAAQFEL